MSEMTNNENVELDDAFFKSYAKKVKEDNESGESGNYEAPEYEQIAYTGCEKGIYKVVRLLGAPIGAESQGYVRRPSDPKEVLMCEVKADDGKRFTIKMPLRQPVAADNYILTRLYDKVMESTKINGDKVFVNKTKHPEMFEKVSKGGFVPADGKTYQYSSGYKGDRLSIYNCIDRADTWCKDNKHSKILCRDLNIDEQNRVWAKPGIKSFGSVVKVGELLGKYGSFEKWDIAFQKTGNKDNPWNVKNASRLKEAQMLEDISNDDGSSIDESKIVIGPLTDEERNYERYDLDKLFAPTSYRKLLKRIPSIFQLVDANLGTKFYDELKELAEKEKAEWDAIKAEREANQAAAENAEIQKNLNMSEDEIKEATSPDVGISDDDVFVGKPTFDKMEEAAPTAKRTRSTVAASGPSYDVSLLKGYDKLSDEIKARIVDVEMIEGKVQIIWDRADDLLECDACGAMSPEEGVTHCPACGAAF